MEELSTDVFSVLNKLYSDYKVTTEKIAEIMGTKHKVMVAEFRARGVVLDQRIKLNRLSDPEIELMVDLFLIYHLSAKDISRIFNISRQEVLRYLHVRGIDVSDKRLYLEEEVLEMMEDYLIQLDETSNILRKWRTNQTTFYRLLKNKGVVFHRDSDKRKELNEELISSLLKKLNLLKDTEYV